MAELSVSRQQDMLLIRNCANGRAWAIAALLSEAESELPGADVVTITLRKHVPDDVQLAPDAPAEGQ